MSRISLMTAVAALLSIAACGRKPAGPWRADQIVNPKELVSELSGSAKTKPLVLHVGYTFLYNNGHIPGAVEVGPASEPDGLSKLKAAVEKLPRETAIVFYCGCCPWSHCPNVQPAFKELEDLGFKNIKVLYLPHNFGQDWTQKGFPTEK